MHEPKQLPIAMIRPLIALWLLTGSAWGQDSRNLVIGTGITTRFACPAGEVLGVGGDMFNCRKPPEFVLMTCTILPSVSASPTLKDNQAVLITGGTARVCEVTKP